MTSSEGGAIDGRPVETSAGRPKLDGKAPDRRAEALRANLRRRKAQTRARDEARPDDPRPAAAPGAPNADT